jgi:imidazolonepropionase
MCFAGSRADEFALRHLGKEYLEINRAGGGIWNTVQKTRAQDAQILLNDLINRVVKHTHEGVTTMEIKSGYGLDLEGELKILRTIKKASNEVSADLIPTCLAAHTVPRDFQGSTKEYLNSMVKQLFPIVLEENLASRVDIFIDQGGFSAEEALPYLTQANYMGFGITIHADQFKPGGSQVGFGLEAQSIDHLEAITERDITFLARSSSVGVVLPGASIGLGMDFAPARNILDQGGCMAIASDWNPGSAPMGNLLVEASILWAFQKLSSAEVFAGLTFRAAQALNLTDRGTLKMGNLADMQAYPISDYREILYHQGSLKPFQVWKKGLAQI